MTNDARAPEEFDVTIAMPTRNAGPILDRVLDVVARQRTRYSHEFMAMDSGSTDGSLDKLRARGIRVVSIPTEQFNWGLTRDLLYQHARSRIVVNLSQDAVPRDEAWLENLVRPLEEDGVGASCGSSIPDPERSFPQFPWERNGYFYFTREIRKFVDAYGRGLSFANSAVPKAVWERLRFDEQPTGEDFQFQRKLHAAGLKVVFPEDAPVLHHHNYTLRGLWRRCRNEGFALRLLGCPYTETDLALDLASPAKFVQLLREIKYGRLHSAADFLFPVARPIAVYMGSRFSRRPIWY
jgi:rhamnosyltransferase